jgi:UDP-N-acetylmuramate dehydrogenase
MSMVQELVARFGADRVKLGAALAPHSTLKVGGPAECLVCPATAEETVDALRIASRAGIPVTLLGGGSNVLIGDRGIRGLVLRPRQAEIESLGGGRVRADAAVRTDRLVRWTIDRGLGGLELWAGTPGTVGGAIAGNAHFSGRAFGERVDTVRLVGDDGTVRDVPQAEMDFGYDRSRLQRTRETILCAIFALGPGDPSQLRQVAESSLARRRETQPLGAASAGCVFRNPDPVRVPLPAGVPPSAGALIDRAGLKGTAIGQARVSPLHANFIVNEGGATARDIRALIDLCRARVRDRFGIELREEIVYLGEFEPAGSEGR